MKQKELNILLRKSREAKDLAVLIFLRSVTMPTMLLLLAVFCGSASAAVQSTFFVNADGIPHLAVVENTGDLSSPGSGMIVYSIDDSKVMIYSGSAWDGLCTSNTPTANDGYFKTTSGISVIPVVGSDPGTSPSGSMYYSTVTGTIRVSNGSTWSDYESISSMADSSGFSAGLTLVRIPVLSSDPSSAGQGAIYINSGSNTLKYYDGSSWWGQNCDPFITRWDMPAGDFTVPTHEDALYNCTIDWGDGSGVSIVTSYDDGDLVHNYTTAGTYDITITGTFGHLYINNGTVKDYLTEVVSWGNPEFSSFYRAFYGCSNLTALPAVSIPAASVTDFSYCFSRCSSLSPISDGLFDYCTAVTDFGGCFYYCTSLSSIPTSLFDNCPNVTNFRNCFSLCSSLSSIPDNLFDYCTAVTELSSCFSMCSSLSTIPTGLFDNCTAVTDFSWCFNQCSSLSTIPTGLFDNCTVVTNFSSCFSRCTSLSSIPSGLFNNCPDVTNFSNCFYYCSPLSSIPDNLFDNCTAVTDFSYCFRYTSITSIPAGLFNNCINVTDFTECFGNCTSLSSIPDNLFDNCTAVTDFSFCFRNTSITSIPDGLFNNCINVTDFSYCFSNDTDLTGNAPELWNTHSSATGTGCFYNCTGLNNYYNIPSAWGGGGP